MAAPRITGPKRRQPQRCGEENKTRPETSDATKFRGLQTRMDRMKTYDLYASKQLKTRETDARRRGKWNSRKRPATARKCARHGCRRRMRRKIQETSRARNDAKRAENPGRRWRRRELRGQNAVSRSAAVRTRKRARHGCRRRMRRKFQETSRARNAANPAENPGRRWRRRIVVDGNGR